ncbi:SDR family NAD(P)-dependent oxidoreductase [Promicromonospora panici]|uniref:SDR family NAD(P)-dependent oxidoreductase n=1 Tax=Promicromonospora panici TaxID=2219658 RepID=UPI00101CCDC7|nr:SDR family oxidoreductase [Promicromonospora panici]
MSRSVAIVSGGAGGLGGHIVSALLPRGFHVVIGDVDTEAGERQARAIEDRGGAATFVPADLSNPGEITRLIESADRLGPLRALANNAGGWLPGPQYPSGDSWRRSIDLNLVMPMLATQLSLPLMAAAGGGSVVNVASSGGWESTPYGSPEYGAAKAGLIRFTTALVGTAAEHSVTVNCVVPHWIGLPRAVEEFDRMTPEERMRSGGLVAPELVASTIVELLTDPEATGRVMVLRAGHHPYQVDPAAADPLWTSPYG